MTVVLIGGGGFIGRHVAAACLASGLTVRIADVHNGKRAPVPADGLPEGVEICVGDYREPTFVADVVKGAHAVVHLAHDAMHLNGRCDMAEEYERNILPAIRLMEACLDAAVQRFVFVSSGGAHTAYLFVWHGEAVHRAYCTAVFHPAPVARHRRAASERIWRRATAV